MTERVTKVGAEVLRSADETADLRTTNVTLEVLAKAPDAQAVFTKSALEVLRRGNANARVTKSVAEVLRDATLPYPSRFNPAINIGAWTNRTTPGLQSEDGVGFHPALVLLTGAYPASEGLVSAHTQFLGVTNGTGKFTGGRSSGTPNSSAFDVWRTDRVYAYNDAGGSNTGDTDADIDSLDANGFTLDFLDFGDDSVAYHHKWVAFADNMQVAVGTFNAPTSNGLQSVDIVDQDGNAFQPQLVIFYATRDTTGAANGALNSGSFPVSLGAMDETGAQWALGERYNNDSYQTAVHDNKCIVKQRAINNDTSPYHAEFDTMDSDGFTIDWTNAPAAAFVIGYIAIAGLDDFHLGVINAPTSIQEVTYSDPGFTPTAIMVAGTAITLNSTSTSGTCDPQFTMGWATQNGQFVQAQAFNDSVGAGNAHHYTNNVDIAAMINSAGSQVMQAVASMSGFTASGFKLNWSTVLGSDNYYPYIAFKAPNYENPDYPVSLIADGLIMGGG